MKYGNKKYKKKTCINADIDLERTRTKNDTADFDTERKPIKKNSYDEFEIR